MSSNLNKCERCNKTIYQADKYEKYEGKFYHSGCFKCSYAECDIKLTTRTVRGFDKIPYCQKHIPNQITSQTKEDERPSIVPRNPISNQLKSNREIKEHKYANIPDSTSNQKTWSVEEDERPRLEARNPILNQSIPRPETEEHKYANISDSTSNQKTLSDDEDQRPLLEARNPISDQSIVYSKEGEEEHVYVNMDNSQSNESDEDPNRINSKSVRKQMKNVLEQSSVTMVDDIFSELSEDMHIVVCGAPRVGKSTLVNAICGVELAKAKEGLESVTKSIDCYVKQGQINTGSKIVNYRYNIWDTPGFESWENKSIKDKVKEILSKPEAKPVCMIFCASPGAFADTKQLEWLLDLCIQEKHIFCALVCTKKYAGQQEDVDAVLNVYDNLLRKYIDQPTKTTNHVTFYGNIGLTALVNSKPYTFRQEILPTEGINELIQGIMESLVDEKVIQWCLVVLENQDFWKNCQNKIDKIFGGFKGKMKHFKDILKFRNK